MTVLHIVHYLEWFINVALAVLLLGLALYAFVSAARASNHAYDVAFKRTKGFWMGVTGGSLVAAALSMLTAYGTGNSSLFLQLIAAVAVGVFLADVKPAVTTRRR